MPVGRRSTRHCAQRESRVPPRACSALQRKYRARKALVSNNFRISIQSPGTHGPRWSPPDRHPLARHPRRVVLILNPHVNQHIIERPETALNYPTRPPRLSVAKRRDISQHSDLQVRRVFIDIAAEFSPLKWRIRELDSRAGLAAEADDNVLLCPWWCCHREGACLTVARRRCCDTANFSACAGGRESASRPESPRK
jgi:hypothetical protein